MDLLTLGSIEVMRRRRCAAALPLSFLIALGHLSGCSPSAQTPVVLARGTLAYAVAWDRDARLWSIELDERFALFERKGADLKSQRRIDLGPADVNIFGLAIADDEVYVGRSDGWIEARPRGGDPRARWPQGAAIADLAVVGATLLALDDTGALCMRRRRDGALLHCRMVADGWRPRLGRSRLQADDDSVEILDEDRRWRVEVPSLREAVAAPLATNGATARDDDQRADVAARYRFPVKATAITHGPRGVVAAGWVRALDQPSLVWWPARRATRH